MHDLSRLLRSLVPAAGLAVAGCAGPAVVPDPPAAFFSLNSLAIAASGGELTVVVRGNPFGGDQAAFDHAVVEALQSRYAGVPTRLTTTPGPSARPDYKVAVIFNPDPALGTYNTCTSRPVPTLPPQGRIVLQAAFCQGEAPATSARGWLAGAVTAEDPDFRQLLYDTAHALFAPNLEFDCGGLSGDC
ncbi:MAG: hypothetical protein GC191_12830 [Azospirillum sp.]|nr:hypothetical protein [Azospirillum sp.]